MKVVINWEEHRLPVMLLDGEEVWHGPYTRFMDMDEAFFNRYTEARENFEAVTKALQEILDD